jgi:hypothetical protein
MRLLTIICEASADAKIVDALDRCEVTGYTRLTGATGRGASGVRDGTSVWPGLNSIIYVGAEEEMVAKVIEELKALDEHRGGRLALKVFSVDAEVYF